MAFSKNLGFAQAIKESSTPPLNKKFLWWDSSSSCHRIYNFETNTWEKLRGETEFLDVGNVEVYNSEESYLAGNTFVSYVNPDSSNPLFHDAALYRCVEDAFAGENPESHLYDPVLETGKWEYQGPRVALVSNNTSLVYIDNLSELRAIEGMGEGDGVELLTNRGNYVFDATSLAADNFPSIVRPNNIEALLPGRWILKGVTVKEAPIDGQQYVRKDGGWVAPEVLQPTISAPTAWDGTLHNIDLSSNAYQTLTVNNGVTVVAIGVTFPADANEKLYEKAILIDNSNNNSAIAAITFDTNSGAYSWEWSVGDPINGIPANGKAEIHLYNRSATVVKALTDVEA